MCPLGNVLGPIRDSLLSPRAHCTAAVRTLSDGLGGDKLVCSLPAYQALDSKPSQSNKKKSSKVAGRASLKCLLDVGLVTRGKSLLRLACLLWEDRLHP